MERDFNAALGARLRAARRSRGYSLTEVEEASDREFKASVLGAYERGERSLSVLRLVRLAALYGVPISQFIPATEDAPEAAPFATIDLERIAAEGESAVVERFLSSILMMRDPDPAAMAVRRSDMALLNSMLESLPERTS